MSTELEVADWIKPIVARQQKPVNKGSYLKANGNIKGTFQENVVLVARNGKFEIPAGATFCVFGPLGGSGTAATIIDPENGNVTVSGSGYARRQPSTQGPQPANSVPRMSVPFGIG